MEKWLIVIMMLVGRGRGDCTDLEHHQMQKRFTDCSTRYRDEHFETTEVVSTDIDLQGATCLLFSQVVDRCGEIWKKCNDDEEIRRMKDFNIEALVDQYSDVGEGVNVEHCAVVREYRNSGRESYAYIYDDHVEQEESDGCNGEKTREVQMSFQQCSHSTSSSVYQTVQDMRDPSDISYHLCKALNTIGTNCIKLLKECYNNEDMVRTREQHLLEMKKYFLKIPLVVEAKVKTESLDNCQALKNTSPTPEPEPEPVVPVVEEYDETNDINGNDPYHHNEHDVDDNSDGPADDDNVAVDVVEVNNSTSAPETQHEAEPIKEQEITENMAIIASTISFETHDAPTTESTEKRDTTGEAAEKQQMAMDDNNNNAGVVSVMESKLMMCLLVLSLTIWL